MSYNRLLSKYIKCYEEKKHYYSWSTAMLSVALNYNSGRQVCFTHLTPASGQLLFYLYVAVGT